MSKFTEAKLEQAFIELLENEGFPHFLGNTIPRADDLACADTADRKVLIEDDLKNYLLNRYKKEQLTEIETQSIILQLKTISSADIYESNKKIMRWLADGFILKREDRKQKDIHIELIDYSGFPPQTQSRDLDYLATEEKAKYDKGHNIYKFVNQLEIVGTEKRIPDGIIYINGLPIVVFEFKSAIREEATIHNAYEQLTIRYKRDIPELFKYNAFCVISDGVQEIFKLGDEAETEQDLFDEDYLAKIDKIKLPNTKIKLLQQLLAKAIGEIKKVNRVKGIDFSKKMQSLVEKYNERKEDDVLRSAVYEEMAEHLTNLIWEVQKEFSAGEEMGINFEEKAFYDILTGKPNNY